jgi:hypothetical protein
MGSNGSKFHNRQPKTERQPTDDQGLPIPHKLMHPKGSKSHLSQNGSTTDDQGLPIPHKLMHPKGSKSRLSQNGSTTNIAAPPPSSTQPAHPPSSAAFPVCVS